MDITLQRIIELMGPAHGSVKGLADAIGINPQIITNWKCGNSKSYSKYIKQIAKYYGVTAEYLLGAEAEAEQKSPQLPEGEGDVMERFAELEEMMMSQEGLMFDGEPLDDVTKELLLASMRSNLEMARQMLKAKKGQTGN